MKITSFISATRRSSDPNQERPLVDLVSPKSGALSDRELEGVAGGGSMSITHPVDQASPKLAY
jgi:hypothetical protein